MKTLYLCGAGNPEGVRLATVVNRAQSRWDRIVILDDDPSKHGQSILGVEIVGPFSLLEQADPKASEISNMVARTTSRRHAAAHKLKSCGLPFATLIDPGVDISGVEFRNEITVYQHVSFCAAAFVDEASVVFTGAVIGHGCRVGRCCVVAPGAVINARVELGEGVYLGTNASILPDLKIGPWATVGANSAVVQNVPAGATVMGVPAQVLVPGGGEVSREAEAAVAPAENPSDARQLPASTEDQPEPAAHLSDALLKLRTAQHKFIESRQSGKTCLGSRAGSEDTPRRRV